MQYGLADVLERMNYRFYHPYKSYVPGDIVEPQILDIQEEWPDSRDEEARSSYAYVASNRRLLRLLGTQ